MGGRVNGNGERAARQAVSEFALLEARGRAEGCAGTPHHARADQPRDVLIHYISLSLSIYIYMYIYIYIYLCYIYIYM